MLSPNTKNYLETSAINYMADRGLPQDALATREYHAAKGSLFYVSSIGLWEILRTKDTGQREILIQYVQNIGYKELIKSPAELIIGYIQAGCPPAESGYSLVSSLPLARVWNDVCLDPRRTFVYDQADLERVSLGIRKGFDATNRMILNEYSPIDSDSKLTFDDLLKQMKTLPYDAMGETERLKFKISMGLMLIVLCYGVDFEEDAIDAYWSTVGITATVEKFQYLLTTHEKLVHSGPFAVLSQMAITQLSKGGKPTRGIFWDVLQSIYLIYTDNFLTADNHFKLLKDGNDHINYQKVIYLPDAGFHKVSDGSAL